MRRLMSLFAALVMAGGIGVVATATPAQAHTTCAAAEFCLYDESWNVYPFAFWDGADAPIGTCLRYISPRTSHIQNRVNHRFYGYLNDTCSGSPAATIYANSHGNISPSNALRSFFSSSLNP